MIGSFPQISVGATTWRLIPSRFPPISTFDTVATVADLAAVMELEGWTNDRLVQHRLARLPQDEWVYGSRNSSVVMAAFLHAAPTGLRFTSGDLGAWYAGFSVRTAIAEVSHHLRREMHNADMPSMTAQYRAYTADLVGDKYVDIRGQAATQPGLYSLTSYAESQVFGEDVRSKAEGIVFDSVRYTGGVNVVCYRPRQVVNVIQAAHYEMIVPLKGRIIINELRQN